MSADHTVEDGARKSVPPRCECHGLNAVPAWRCAFGGIHTKGVHHREDTPLLPADEVWDFGYACGLGDYGKGDDETVAMNPYRVTPPAPTQEGAES